ncbi:uncharacterized protein Tco025E_04439 [Trypanosoma conorhini]|uniref:EF-hand domain-containing protein n=1 Tax=Trypanosoma conorhini TaxID=83891 RepID=A0A3R7PE00_9TRYP|nr:uncharacterized protein Tco025E_04439 [Trypanosoma conorhini]RNF18542.1 hypothetical protein Tco025E_04439 [Trypanosoma conorhini]
MSDSESIVFREQTETDSPHGGSLRGPRDKPHQPREALQLLERPPLPHSKRRSSVAKAPPSPKTARPRSSSAAAEGGRDERASEHNQSVQFHFDSADTNASTATGGAASAAHTPQLPPTHEGGGERGEAPPAGGGRSSSQRTDWGDESIQFFMEASSNRSRPRVLSRSASVPNDSIVFHVMDGSQAGGAAPLETGTTPQDTDAESAVSTILHEAEETDESALAKTRRPSSASHAQRVEEEGGKPPAKAMPAKTAKTAKMPSKRLQRIRPASAPSGRGAPPPPPEDTQGAKLAGKAPSFTPSVAQKEASLRHSPAMPAPEAAETDAAHPVPASTRPGAAPVPSKEAPRLTKAAATGVAKASPPTRRSQSANSVGRAEIKHAPTAVGKALSERSPPRVSAEVPVPYPKTQADATQSSAPYLLDEWILQAKLYTEHWRLFNDVQREEIARLVERIAKARQPEHRLCSLDTDAREKQPSAAALGGFADLFRQRHPITQDPAVAASAAATSTSHAAQAGRGLRPGSPRPALSLPPSGVAPRGPSAPGRRRDHGVTATRLLKAAAARQSPPELQELQHAPVQAARGGWFARLRDTAAGEGAAKLAQTLGVIWPPLSPDALFFMTGARLTPQQRDEFYEAVELQSAASGQMRTELRRAAASQKLEKKDARRKKLTPSRTSILRKAFALMDVDKRGSLCTTDLPALQHLLEAERKELEATAKGGAATATVLSRARGELRQLTGTIAANRTAANTHGESPSAAAEAMLYGLVIDVIFPIIRAANLVVIDFASLGLLVFGSLYLSEKGASASFMEWRQAAHRYFEAFA